MVALAGLGCAVLFLVVPRVMCWNCTGDSEAFARAAQRSALIALVAAENRYYEEHFVYGSLGDMSGLRGSVAEGVRLSVTLATDENGFWATARHESRTNVCAVLGGIMDETPAGLPQDERALMPSARAASESPVCSGE